MKPGWYVVEELPFSEDTSPIGWFPSRPNAEIAALDANYPYVSFFDGVKWGYLWPVNEPKPTRQHAQSRIDSLAESITNTAIGFMLSLVTWHFVAMGFGIPMPLSTNLAITGIFTVVSIARQYVLRRIFDGRSPWQAIKGCVGHVSTVR